MVFTAGLLFHPEFTKEEIGKIVIFLDRGIMEQDVCREVRNMETEKNRFSQLLEQLMNLGEIKNAALAKALQYDVSYISK